MNLKIFESCKSYALLVSCHNFFNLAINRHWKEFAELRRRKEIEYIENTKNIGDLVTKVKLRSEIFQPYLLLNSVKRISSHWLFNHNHITL